MMSRSGSQAATENKRNLRSVAQASKYSQSTIAYGSEVVHHSLSVMAATSVFTPKGLDISAQGRTALRAHPGNRRRARTAHVPQGGARSVLTLG
jgi:hypothetical protein